MLCEGFCMRVKNNDLSLGKPQIFWTPQQYLVEFLTSGFTSHKERCRGGCLPWSTGGKAQKPQEKTIWFQLLVMGCPVQCPVYCLTQPSAESCAPTWYSYLCTKTPAEHEWKSKSPLRWLQLSSSRLEFAVWAVHPACHKGFLKKKTQQHNFNPCRNLSMFCIAWKRRFNHVLLIVHKNAEGFLKIQWYNCWELNVHTKLYLCGIEGW